MRLNIHRALQQQQGHIASVSIENVLAATYGTTLMKPTPKLLRLFSIKGTKPLRYALGAIVIVFYILSAVFAIFPESEIGQKIYGGLAMVCGFFLASMVASAALYICHSLVSSLIQWKRANFRSWNLTWAAEESLFSRLGVISAQICLFFVVSFFWIAVIGFGAYIVSFGNLGFIPHFQGTP